MPQCFSKAFRRRQMAWAPLIWKGQSVSRRSVKEGGRKQGAYRVLRDGDGLIQVIGVLLGDVAVGHGSEDEHDGLIAGQRLDKVPRVHERACSRESCKQECVSGVQFEEREAHATLTVFLGVGWQVLGDGVLDHIQQRVVAVAGADLERVQQLHCNDQKLVSLAHVSSS